MRSPDNTEAEFRGVLLAYRGKVRGAGGGAIYGARQTMAGEGEFEVTFRVKDCADLPDWTWLPRVHAARVVGLPPRLDAEEWSEKFKVSLLLVGDGVAVSYRMFRRLFFADTLHVLQHLLLLLFR